MPLTDAQIKGLKPAERPTKHSDGGGLHLLVSPQGSKLWRQAYRFDGKQKTLSLGSYPVVSLAEARQKREAAKKLLAADQLVIAAASLQNIVPVAAGEDVSCSA